jgi:tryptophan-rich sensory protein
VLFIMIAVSGWMVWRTAGWSGAALPLGIWVAQLVVNFAWSGFFFGLRRMDWALADLMLLWLGILATIIAFAPVNATAAWLLVPYLAWVTFAGVLNYTMWRLNPSAATAPASPAAG